MTEVESSMIAAVEYSRKVLKVRFNTGAVYAYANVPKAVYTAFMEAESKGKFFNQNIKLKYPWRRIE